MASDFSAESRKRALQLEAVAHIEVQRKIDVGEDGDAWPATMDYASWLHREFCSRLPEELLWVEHPGTGKRFRVVPGMNRSTEVVVGRHLPPEAHEVERFMARFDEAYAPARLSQLRRIQATGAIHHRLLWVHPFLDGNGRVARLMSHALLKRTGVDNPLWSVSRGLARRVNDYKALLMAADGPCRGDWDGRGNLTQAALVAFCRFFLETCLDQVRFMSSVLETTELLQRIEIYVETEARARRLPAEAFPVLREALLAGELTRGRAGALTGFQERKGREVVSTLLAKGLLVSTMSNHKAPVMLGFPIDVVERWFPRLYPAGIG